MSLIPEFLAPARVGARLLNKLLGREEWARERLARHAGKTVRFVLGHSSAQLTILFDGCVQASDPAVMPNVTLTIPVDRLSELPQALRNSDPDAITALLHVQGDAALAGVVSD